VLITKRGYVKRLLSDIDFLQAEIDDEDEIQDRIRCRNTESLLVFTYSGECFKIPVYSFR